MPNNSNYKIENQRIAKIISRSGAYSRRDAEKLIIDRRIKINGELVLSPITFVTSRDTISIDDKVLSYELTTKIWILNKPKGYITTTKDPQKRETVFSLLPRKVNHLISIGRLDINTEGLLLFTNNGVDESDNQLNPLTSKYDSIAFFAGTPTIAATLTTSLMFLVLSALKYENNLCCPSITHAVL